MTFAVPSELRFKFLLAERLSRTVGGMYDREGNLLEPGIDHMEAKEYRFWKVLHARLNYERETYGGK